MYTKSVCIRSQYKYTGAEDLNTLTVSYGEVCCRGSIPGPLAFCLRASVPISLLTQRPRDRDPPPQLAAFYGVYCSHFTAENTTDVTRVSLDFRLIPGKYLSTSTEHRLLCPGTCTYLLILTYTYLHILTHTYSAPVPRYLLRGGGRAAAKGLPSGRVLQRSKDAGRWRRL